MVRKVLAAAFAVVGLILLLSGVGLITITQTFMLYIGAFLLLLSALLFLTQLRKHPNPKTEEL